VTGRPGVIDRGTPDIDTFSVAGLEAGFAIPAPEAANATL
jgi:hypothetical protein